MEGRKALKEKLAGGEVCIGTFFKSNCPDIMEIVGFSGFDFALLDREHANFSPQETENMIRTADCAGIDVMVRIPSPNEEHIVHALDSGAKGVVVPGVSSVEQAREIASFTKFFPEGRRGMNGGARAAKYGNIARDAYMKKANAEGLTFVMIECVAMVELADKICQIPQLDGVFVGPADLSQSMSVPGQVDHPDLEKLVAKVCAAAKRNGKAAGIFAASTEAVERYIQYGARFIAYGTELSILNGAIKKLNESLDVFRNR
jgi:4-hydroxy-2-oxoheptanedioate aldolase